MPDTVQGPILVLPDENPPLEYDYELPVFSRGAAFAAESSADALGAQVKKRTEEAGVAGLLGFLQGNWGEPGTNMWNAGNICGQTSKAHR